MNRTYSPSHTPLSPAQAHYLSTHRPFYYNTRAQLLDWCPDPILSLAVPILAYWSCSIFFHLLDVSGWKWLDKYRIHESPEIVARNLASRAEVLRSVLLQQVMQTLAGFLWMEEQASGELVNHAGHMLRLQPALNGVLAWALGAKLGARTMDRDGARLLYAIYWWAIPTVRLLWCMFLMDTWQYFLHRAMHTNRWLYKHFHSVHHRLNVPYAFGASYNHPLEGFVLEAVGAGFAEALSGLTTREAMFLFFFATVKGVDDHCGYRLPFDPLQCITSNNADYHDIHHQAIGMKSNYAQPFFVHWDTLLDTKMTRADIQQRRQSRKKLLSDPRL